MSWPGSRSRIGNMGRKFSSPVARPTHSADSNRRGSARRSASVRKRKTPESLSPRSGNESLREPAGRATPCRNPRAQSECRDGRATKLGRWPPVAQCPDGAASKIRARQVGQPPDRPKQLVYALFPPSRGRAPPRRPCPEVAPARRWSGDRPAAGCSFLHQARSFRG
jgi:hypothetical protein